MLTTVKFLEFWGYFNLDILIRKEPNGSIYIDKKNAALFEALKMNEAPYNFKKIIIDENYSDCEPADFNEDLTFNIEKYNNRKLKIVNDKKITANLNRMSELSKDFIQMVLGAEIPDIDVKKQEFVRLHNEVRSLNGLSPRSYKLI